MKYVVDIICNGVWFNYSKDIKDSDLVKNSQTLVKDLVKENDRMDFCPNCGANMRKEGGNCEGQQM